MRRISRSRSLSLTLAALAAQAGLTACGSGSGTPAPSGATDFVSAPFAGQGGGATDNGAAAGTSAAAPAAPATSGAGKSSKPTTRTVQETDLYRLDGNRLYYLNSYRGLMVFDVTTSISPKLLGRSPIFGTPVDMIVSNGIATVVVGDWYGTLDDGTPFHGSIVRGLDATDPTNIKVLGDAKLGGWVQETASSATCSTRSARTTAGTTAGGSASPRRASAVAAPWSRRAGRAARASSSRR